MGEDGEFSYRAACTTQVILLISSWQAIVLIYRPYA